MHSLVLNNTGTGTTVRRHRTLHRDKIMEIIAM